MFMIITSTSNQRIKDWEKLKLVKYRRLTRRFIVEGEHLILEAYKAGLIECLIKLADYSYELAGVETVEVSEEVMRKLSTNVSSNKLVAICYFKDEDQVNLTDKIVILDCVQDPSNVGGIMRTSLALGYQTLILSSDTVDLYNEKLLKAAQGASFKLNVLQVELFDTIKTLKSKGYQIIVSDLKSAIDLKEVVVMEKFCLVFGNEGNGVSKEIIEMADVSFKIPMANDFDSLNILSAASISLYHLFEK